MVVEIGLLLDGFRCNDWRRKNWFLKVLNKRKRWLHRFAYHKTFVATTGEGNMVLQVMNSDVIFRLSW